MIMAIHTVILMAAYGRGRVKTIFSFSMWEPKTNIDIKHALYVFFDKILGRHSKLNEKNIFFLK